MLGVAACVEIWGLIRLEVLREIRVPDDLRPGSEKLRVVARVIGMVVRHDQELHRLIRYGFDLVDESGVVLIARQLTVDEDYPALCQAYQRIRTGPGHHI